MSIVKMKHLRLIGLISEREALFQNLLLRGCVEITEIPDATDKAWAALVQAPDTNLAELKADFSRLSGALAALDKYAPEKTGLFTNRELIDTATLFSSDIIEPSVKTADDINLLDGKISRLYTMCSNMETSKTSLEPWAPLDVPLDIPDTRTTAIAFGTVPQSVPLEDLERELYGTAVQSQLFIVNSGKENHSFMMVCHKAQLEYAVNVLRSFGYNQVSFGDAHGTALQNIRGIDDRLEKTRGEIDVLKAEVRELSAQRPKLKLCYDRLAQEIAKAEAAEKLVVSGSVFAMEGWLSAPELDGIDELLQSYTCAYETSDPEPEEFGKVPVKLKNNKLTYPLNMVTEMYSLPAYNGIDPNGLIMPFFTIFFGIMYADLGYGIILTLVALIAKRKLRLRGVMEQMMGLLLMVGITTAAFGFIFGGFFGDVIPVLTETFGVSKVEIWALIDPMQNPMLLLIGSCVLGAIHLMTGMLVKIYIGFRDGQALDAVLDVVPWWILFAGFGALYLGYGSVLTWVGVASLVLTQGRKARTIPGKILGGIASLYDVTSWLSDILSYLRLMALLLATSVIASVVNTLGAMTGNIFTFFIVFLIGHGFNMGINIIGTFVHAARLQYLEFFGKFYRQGGIPFRPLKVSAKYHDITAMK